MNFSFHNNNMTLFVSFQSLIKNDVSTLGINKKLITDQRDQKRAPLVHCAAVAASLASLSHAHVAHRRCSLTKHRG